MSSAEFDWQHPDYSAVIRARVERLGRLRANPELLPALRAHYAERPADFINDWGSTYDPRNPERGLPASMPFLLFHRQREMVEFLVRCWRAQEPGLIEKSRDMGASWLMMAFAATMCLFHHGLTFGIGSRKEELVDRSGDPSSLFFKARHFLQTLPPEFLGGWDVNRHSAHMRLSFPATGSAITGEGGDQIGRGGRASMYFIDESAFLERPQLIDGSLSATTNCRIDISTPNGRGNSFAEKRFSGRIPVFSMHWRHDPRKSQAWYDKQCSRLDPVTIAREIDLDYSGSVANQLIPAAWVQSAVGAHLKLGIIPSGIRCGSLDPADQGRDANGFAGRHGIVVEHALTWSGKGSDIYETVVKAFSLCDAYRYDELIFDSDGLGSGVRGDARRINEDRTASGQPNISDVPFRGSASPESPDAEMVQGRKNIDLFANAKAQAWWSLRLRFQATHRAIAEGLEYVADDLISLDPGCEELTALMMELSQPTFSLNSAGKILVNKQPDGTRSPNLGDAVALAFRPKAAPSVASWTSIPRAKPTPLAGLLPGNDFGIPQGSLEALSNEFSMASKTRNRQ